MEIAKRVAKALKRFPGEVKFPEYVKIVEVSPRDGLQNEKEIIPAETKVELINRLSNTGIPVVEVTSFVSPKWVPQMGDNKEVFTKIDKKDGVSYPVLTPNVRGLESALEVGAQEVAIFAAASEAFTKKNINCTIAESIERFEPLVEKALAEGLKVRGYVSCVMGCPYEGEIDLQTVNTVSQKLLEMGCYEISLGDTIGIGNMDLTQQLVDTVDIPKEKLAAHFHNTYDRAIENLVVALANGVSVIDASVGGIGGCPYAKGATGNVPTEDVVYMLSHLGIKHGIDLKELISVGDFISGELGRERLSEVTIEDVDRLE